MGLREGIEEGVAGAVVGLRGVAGYADDGGEECYGFERGAGERGEEVLRAGDFGVERGGEVAGGHVLEEAVLRVKLVKDDLMSWGEGGGRKIYL